MAVMDYHAAVYNNFKQGDQTWNFGSWETGRQTASSRHSRAIEDPGSEKP